MLALKALFFTVLLPGTVTIVVPYFIVAHRAAARPLEFGWPGLFGIVPIIVGGAVLLKCIWDFAAIGRGTLAPVDPPKELVVRGLYRFVRNPMYVGVLLVLFGEALLFASWELAVFAAAFFLVAHIFVVIYEEPTLSRQFGESYAQYRNAVGRWLPRLPPHRG